MFARITLTVAALLISTAAVAAPSAPAQENRCETAVCRAMQADRGRLGSVFEQPEAFAQRLDQALRSDDVAQVRPEAPVQRIARR